MTIQVSAMWPDNTPGFWTWRSSESRLRPVLPGGARPGQRLDLCGVQRWLPLTGCGAGDRPMTTTIVAIGRGSLPQPTMHEPSPRATRPTSIR